jgi:hypothetical protein
MLYEKLWLFNKKQGISQLAVAAGICTPSNIIIRPFSLTEKRLSRPYVTRVAPTCNLNQTVLCVLHKCNASGQYVSSERLIIMNGGHRY